MAEFIITITDPLSLAGITAAHNAYNATLQLTPAQGVEGEEGYVPAQALADHPDYKATDADYVQFVMARAAESYANQYGA